jgi:hypothetical protein
MLSCEIIDALGGPANLADLLGCTKFRVGMWRLRGIPPGSVAAVSTVARLCGHAEITQDVVTRSTPAPRAAARRRRRASSAAHAPPP